MPTSSASPAEVIAPGGAGFFDRDAEQARQLRFQSIPYPASQVFARRISESFNLVEIVMVEAPVDWRKSLAYLRVIDEPSSLRVHQTPNRYFTDERMAVEPFAFMTLRNSGQAMGCFEPEFLYELDYHSNQILSPSRNPPQTYYP